MKIVACRGCGAPATVNVITNAADADGTVTKVEFFNGTAKLGEATASPYGYAWTGDLAIGAVVTITASMRVANPDAGNKTLTTVASSSAAGTTCRAASPNPACTAVVQVLVPALTITKSAEPVTSGKGRVALPVQ